MIGVGQYVDGGPHETDWVKRMRGLLAKRVVVTLNDDASVQLRGVLIAFTDQGEVCLMEPWTGETTWGWPCLHVAELPPQCAVFAMPRPAQVVVSRELLDDRRDR
jgi:hypothetical protein